MSIKVMKRAPEAPSQELKLANGTGVGRASVLCESPVWAGLWECEPKSWDAEFESDETMFILGGSLSFKNENENYSLSTGEAVFFPQGSKGTIIVGADFRAWVVVS